MNRDIYASDCEYTLCPITKEDIEYYYPNAYSMIDDEDLPYMSNILWKRLMAEGNRVYLIFDDNSEYCGNIELQHPDDDTPEIGIDLLEHKRNKGIAAKVVRLLARQTYEEKPVEYFLIRIHSKNSHSRHVFEKMGAVLIGEESTFYDRFISALKDEGESELLEYIQNRFDNNADGEKSVVYRYKLTPDVFNK